MLPFAHAAYRHHLLAFAPAQGLDGEMNETRSNLSGALRSLRTRNGWTLQQMSERVGIAVSTLSKVENDKLSLSYEKLQQLSNRLDIDVGVLFDPQRYKAMPENTGRQSVSSDENSLTAVSSAYYYRFLCTNLRFKAMTPSLVQVLARSLDEHGSFSSHEGEEYIFVISGQIEFHSEHYDKTLIRQGGSIYFDASTPHAVIVAKPAKAATIISVATHIDTNLIDIIAKGRSG